MEALYQQIKKWIRDSIDNHIFNEHDKIPSEAELCAQFSASRITVVRAINDLVSEGLLVRYQGKGSFVANKPLQEGTTSLQAFSERMSKAGHVVSNQVLSLEYVSPIREISKMFNLASDTKLICLKRIRCIDGQPFCYSTSYLNSNYFTFLFNEDLKEASLYNLVEKKYHHPLGNGLHRISAVLANQQQAEFLQCSKKANLLKMTTIAYFKNQDYAEYDFSYYRGDLYEFEMPLVRP